jgi:hypothetical protein
MSEILIPLPAMFLQTPATNIVLCSMMVTLLAAVVVRRRARKAKQAGRL